MIDAIHQSMLSIAFRCGESFRRRYMLGEIIPPGIAAGCGTGVHKANEVNIKHKIITGRDIPISDMQDAARDGFVQAFENGIYLTRDERPAKNRILNDGLNDTLRLTWIYGQEVSPLIIKPTNTEREFNIDVGLPLPLAGRIDFEERGRVGDLKTAGKSWPSGRISSEIQPIFYSLAYEHETGIRPEFRYLIIVALKQPKLQTQSITVTDRGYTALFQKIKVFCEMLQRGVFLPADPSNWLCSEKWCGYYRNCKYVGN